jgi:hypothetical protein
LVIVAVHHQDLHSNLLQVFGEIGLREGDDTVVVRLCPAHHALAPPVLDDGLRGFHTWPVETVERPRRNVTIKLRAIGRELRLEPIKDFLGKATWIGLGLDHQRRNCADNRGFRYSALAMPRYVVDHFAAAGRMTHMDGVRQIQIRCQRCEVVGIVVHVMAVAGLARPSVAAPVMGDDPIAVLEKEQHLGVPVVS